MCGPSGQQVAESNSSENFTNQLTSNYATLFSEEQGNIQNLKNILNPIAAAGESQTGMSPEELAALNTQAIDSSGASYANEARALGSQLAGRGGSSGLESGVSQQLKAGLASEAGSNLANNELNITNENYAQGRQNFQNALGGLETLNNAYNATAAASPAINSAQNAFNMATTDFNEGQQGLAMIGGIAGAGLSALSGGLSNLDTTGGSSFGEQVGNFIEGA
jgi:hypothetical protein